MVAMVVLFWLMARRTSSVNSDTALTVEWPFLNPPCSSLSSKGVARGAEGGLAPPPPKLTPAGLNESCKDWTFNKTNTIRAYWQISAPPRPPPPPKILATPLSRLLSSRNLEIRACATLSAILPDSGKREIGLTLFTYVGSPLFCKSTTVAIFICLGTLHPEKICLLRS